MLSKNVNVFKRIRFSKIIRKSSYTMNTKTMVLYAFPSEYLEF